MDELAGGEEDGPAPEAGSERAGLTQTNCWCLGFKVQEKEFPALAPAAGPSPLPFHRARFLDRLLSGSLVSPSGFLMDNMGPSKERGPRQTNNLVGNWGSGPP